MVAMCDNVRPPMTRGELDGQMAAASALPFPGYYFGDRAGDYALDGIYVTGPNDQGGPQVDADYGPCEGGQRFGDDGGCSNPLDVTTQPWAPTGNVSCRRLEPQMGVPTAVLYGRLTVFTGNVKVILDDPEVKEGLSLLRTLRPMGRTGPVTSLPPPTKAIVSWVDQVCGPHPGDSREAPKTPQTPETPGSNTTVQAFTVQRFGGGQRT